MNKEKMLMLEEYLKLGTEPILLENISSDIFENAIVLNSNCDVSLLNGHYEGIDFIPPIWYTKLINQNNNKKPLLIIDKLNSIPLEQQTKFIEILKYRKISTFNLPKDCIIIVTCTNLKEHKINEEVYSLTVHI